MFERDPVNLIRIFAVAEETGTFFHPNALRLIRGSLRLIDDKLRRDPEANRIFLELLDLATRARRRRCGMMNEAGVLGRFVPEFGQVVAMMQFNMYHHYTVDEHLVRTVGELKRDRGRQARRHAAAVDRDLRLDREPPRALRRRAAARRRQGPNGGPLDRRRARSRAQLCPRLGLTPAETETVAWLIEEHLTMSNIAQSRDLGDPKTIRDFAAVVQSPERLKLLLLLTVADIRAVGPGTWNGWKGQLLRQLYWETEPLVAGGHTLVGRKDRIAAAQEALRPELPDWPAAEVERFIARHYDDYWLKTDTRKQADHARLMRTRRDRGQEARHRLRDRRLHRDHRADRAGAEPSPPAGAVRGRCAAAGANIIGAHISTTRDGLALDTFLLQREFAEDDDERRRVNRIARTIDSVLKGEARLGQLMAKRKPPERRISAFHVEPQVVINNELSDDFTVIEVDGARPAGPALRPDEHAVGPVARHHVGAHHDLRREGGRRVLRHRPDGQEDRRRAAAEGDPPAACRCAARRAAGAAREPAATRRDAAGIADDRNRCTGGTRAMKFSFFMMPCHDPRENPTLAFQRDIGLVHLADRLGFDEFFIGEHHSGGWETMPAPEMALAMAAANAHRIRLGTSVFSAPFHHPFHLAERMCFLDHLTHGRAILGVGPCSLVTDKILFNMDDATLYPMLHEAIDVIVRLLEAEEPISHEGRLWQFRDLRLQLRSFQQPRLPLAMPSAATPANLELIGRHGMIWMCPVSRSARGIADLGQRWAHVEKGARAAGRTADRGNWRLSTAMYLAESADEAWADARAGILREAEYFSSIGFRALYQQHPGQRFEDFTAETAVDRRDWVIGTPDDAIAWIERKQAETGGFGGVMLTAHEWASPEKIAKSLELFARYVMPHFNRSNATLQDEWRRIKTRAKDGQVSFEPNDRPGNLWKR